MLGQRIEVHTDHKNLTCENFNTDRVYRWRLLLEEYGPDIKYIEGPKNVAAGALSRLSATDDICEELNCLSEEIPDIAYPLNYKIIETEQGKDKQLGENLKIRSIALRPFMGAVKPVR